MRPSKENPYQTTPVLDYPEHSHRHHRIEDEIGLAAYLDTLALVDEGMPAPRRADRFIDRCINHQVGIAVALWMALVAAGLAIWMIWW